MKITIMVDEERYTNRQIERFFDDQNQSFDKRLNEQTRDIKDFIEARTSPILAQAMKTNGRVNTNEDDIVKYKVWRGWMTGGLAVIGTLIPIIVGLQVWMLLQIINIPNQVQTAISTWAQSSVLKVTQ